MGEELLNPNEFALGESEFTLVDEVQATMSPNHDRLLIRKIDGIDPTYINLSVSDLRQRTSIKNEKGKTCNWVDSPRVGDKGPGAGGREFPGVWRGVSVRGYIRAGTSSVVQTLAFGLIRSAEDVWPSPELVKTADRLLRPHAIQDDPTMTQKEVRYRGFDPSYVDAARSSIALTAGVVDVRSVRMQDGSYNIHVLTETPSWATFVVTAPDTISKKNYNTDFEEIVEVWNSIKNDDSLTGLYTTNTTGYRITDVEISDELDGSIKVVRTETKTKAFDANNPDVVWYENRYREREVMHELWYGIDADDPFTGLWNHPPGYSILRAPKSTGQNGIVSVERESALKNDWYVDVLLLGGSGTRGDVYVSSNSGATFTAVAKSLNFYSVASSADGTKLVASVLDGQLYTSTDSGATWTARDSVRKWTGVCSSTNGTKLVALDAGGHIYTSTDSGVSWTAREMSRAWRAVACSDDGTKLVAVAYGWQIYTSTDSGANWTARDSSRNWYGVASNTDGTKLVATVDGGQIYTSVDAGATWTPRDSDRSWRGVASSSDGVKLVAVDFGGHIYTSTDSGANWTARSTNKDWWDVSSASDGVKLVAVVKDGQIYTSTDSGATWTSSDSNRSWTSVSSSTDGVNIVAVTGASNEVKSFGYTRSGVISGFENLSFVSQHIPIADAEEIVKSLMKGTGITAWSNGVDYVEGDIRTASGHCYRASSNFTSKATMILDIAEGVWDRISAANYSNSDGNVCTIVFDTEPALEYGFLEETTDATEHTPTSDTYVWTNVDPVRLDTVWALAVAYVGTSRTITHRKAHKTFDARGIATITAEAWTPVDDEDGSGAGNWEGSANLNHTRIEIVYRKSEWQDAGDWCYRTITFDVKYFWAVAEAWDEIDGGLEGSTVDAVPGVRHIFRSIRIKSIVDGAWQNGPLNAAAS